MSNTLDDFLASDAFWTQVAEFAHSSYTRYDRGAVLLHEQKSHQESTNRANVAISYLPSTDESSLWTEDNQAMVNDYEPGEEFMVISVQADGEALSMVMGRRDDNDS